MGKVIKRKRMKRLIVGFDQNGYRFSKFCTVPASMLPSEINLIIEDMCSTINKPGRPSCMVTAISYNTISRVAKSYRKMPGAIYKRKEEKENEVSS